MRSSHLPGFALIFSTVVSLASCHNVKDIPFPQELSEFPQPQAVPLELTAPKPLHWDTIGQSEIKPTVFPLDFSRMKGQPYDAHGFKPLPAPTESIFDFSSLPSKPFDLSKVPVHKIQLKMHSLASVFPTVKVGSPERVAASSLDLSVMQQLTGAATSGPGYILKDSLGFMWMGSTYGLYRYDGSHLETIIPAMNVAGMNMDKQGRIWFISQSSLTASKIVMLDFKNRKYGQMDIPYGFAYSNRMFHDSEGSLWIGSSPTNGLVPVFKIDPATMSYQILDATSGLKNQRYYQMVEDGNKNMWLCSHSGIDIIMHDWKRLVQVGKANGLSDDDITALTSDGEGRIWAAWPEGVDIIDLKNNKVTHYHLSSSPSRTLKLMFDKNGQLWQSVIGGVFVTDFNKKAYRTINEADGLPSGTFVDDIFDDGHGKVYLSGMDNSLAGATYIIGQYGKTAYPFGNEPIYSSVEDARGHLWIGTPKQLYAVDSARKTYWRINSSSGMANDTMEAILPLNGKVVITTNGGYNVYDPIKSQLLRFSKAEGLPAEVVYWVMPGKDGNQWISATTQGLFKYNPETHLMLNLTDSGGLNGNYIIQTTQQMNGNVWSMTNETPGIIDPMTNTIRTIKNIPELIKQVEKIIFVDSHDRTWLGIFSQFNDGRLFMIDSSYKTYTEFSTKNGLSNNGILSILEKDGRIIVSTPKMINIITSPELSPTKKWKIQIMKGSENLVKKENTYVSDAITMDGNYLWGDDGIHIIYGIEADTGTSKCFVTGMNILAQPVNFKEINDTSGGRQNAKWKNLKWDALSGPYAMPVNLTLPSQDNVLQFHFTEMSTGRLDTTTYAYILEGIDKRWNTTTDDHTQTYLNLSPGDYTLKVRSRWTSGEWSEPYVMSFTIRPPWYQTWWAYLIYAVIAGSLLRIYIVFRSRKLMRQNKILEEKVNQRTEELQRSYNNVEQLGQIGRKITSSLSVEKVIGTIYSNVNALMDAAIFGIGIYNPDKNILEFPATFEEGEQLPPYTNALNETNRFSAVCFNSGQDIVMGDVGEQYENYIQHYLNPSAGRHANSLVYLPLIVNDKKLGVFTVQSFEKNAYSENDLNILHNIAIYATIALENAGTYSKLNQSLENLKAAQAQLVQTEKMASLGELTAGIAHEIQNPLNFVNNFSELNKELVSELKSENAKPEADRDNGMIDEILSDIVTNSEKINFHGKRADAIVKGMLQHSRSTSGKKEPTDINALCDEYLRLSFHGLRAKDKSFNAKFETHFDESIVKINVVPQDIGRVVLNLINNAFYAVTERKKKVNSLNGSSEYVPEVIVSTQKVNDKSDGSFVEISVKDNGNGIPHEIMKKIFQPFFTTKPAGKGTGLGLSLSYDIVKAHNGELKVESKEGEGTEFTIQLPTA